MYVFRPPPPQALRCHKCAPDHRCYKGAHDNSHGIYSQGQAPLLGYPDVTQTARRHCNRRRAKEPAEEAADEDSLGIFCRGCDEGETCGQEECRKDGDAAAVYFGEGRKQDWAGS